VRKLNVTILVGVIVAVLGFAMVFAYGRNVDEKVADGRQTRPVLVITQAVPAGVTAERLSSVVEVQQVPTAYVPDGALEDLSQVSGKVLLGPLGANQQLSSASFGTQAQAAAAGGAVQPSKGKVALAVQTELTPGVARYIQAGSSVDLFVTYGGASVTSGAAGEATNASTSADRTKLFLSGVKVLTVEAASTTSESSDGTTSTVAVTNGVLTVLDLTPTDAERVVNATTNGKIYMGLSAVSGDAPIHRTPTGASADDVLRNNR